MQKIGETRVANAAAVDYFGLDVSATKRRKCENDINLNVKFKKLTI